MCLSCYLRKPRQKCVVFRHPPLGIALQAIIRKDYNPLYKENPVEVFALVGLLAVVGALLYGNSEKHEGRGHE